MRSIEHTNHRRSVGHCSRCSRPGSSTAEAAAGSTVAADIAKVGRAIDFTSGAGPTQTFVAATTAGIIGTVTAVSGAEQAQTVAIAVRPSSPDSLAHADDLQAAQSTSESMQKLEAFELYHLT